MTHPLVLAELRKRATDLELRAAQLQPIPGQAASRATANRYWERTRVQAMARDYRALIAWAEANDDA